MNKHSKLIVSALVAGLMVGGTALCQAQAHDDATAGAEKKNACSGKDGCSGSCSAKKEKTAKADKKGKAAATKAAKEATKETPKESAAAETTTPAAEGSAAGH